ncbi:MAG: thioredoxin-dependent thiol peroxidase [Tepidiformaceae bacterium]
MPQAGQDAPAFELNDHEGKAVSLEGLHGRRVVLYFYPKDDTPGCTREACGFRDSHAALETTGAVVLGISGDSEASHAKFAGKYGLPFRLLSDPDNQVARAYGAWGTKQNYGKTYEGIIRSTFGIDAQGRVAKVWPRVKPEGHAEQVLAWLKEDVR